MICHHSQSTWNEPHGEVYHVCVYPIRDLSCQLTQRYWHSSLFDDICHYRHCMTLEQRPAQTKVLSWNVIIAIWIVLISRILIRLSFSRSNLSPTIVNSCRCTPQPVWDMSLMRRKGGGSYWKGTPADRTSSCSHHSTLSLHSQDMNWLAAVFFAHAQWGLNCQWSEHILGLPCSINGSREIKQPRSCCHGFASGLGDDTNLEVTSQNLVIQESDGYTLSWVASINIPRYWALWDGSRSIFSKLMTRL